MLLDVNDFLSAGKYSEKDAFKSLTVSFSNYQIVMTVSNDKIYCVKKGK